MLSETDRRLAAFLKKYRLDGSVPEEARALIDALRYREQNLAIKAGATLGFCGLIIACILVQMSAPSESMIFVSRDSPWANFARGGLMLLLLSSFMSLVAITWGRSAHSEDIGRALGEMAATLAHKRVMRIIGSLCCLAGSMCAAICLLGPLLA